MIRRLASISLLIIIAFASIGFNVNAHICQGKVKTIAIFIEAQACEAMESGSCTEVPPLSGINRVPCCNNLHFCSDVSEFESPTFIQTDSQTADLSPVYSTLVESPNQINRPFVCLFDTGPPIGGDQDVQVLYQVYLI
ncbi:MAG: hypothetical protein ACI8SE_001860 [Bacteroidia bacterium]